MYRLLQESSRIFFQITGDVSRYGSLGVEGGIWKERGRMGKQGESQTGGGGGGGGRDCFGLKYTVYREKSVSVRPKRSLFAQCSAAVIRILTWTSLTLLTVGCQRESSIGANINSVQKTVGFGPRAIFNEVGHGRSGDRKPDCVLYWLVVIVNELGHRRSRCQKQGWTVGPFAVESWFLFFSHSNSSFSFHLRTFMKEITMPQEIAVAACALSEWRVAGIPKRNTSKQVLRSCTSRIH